VVSFKPTPDVTESSHPTYAYYIPHTYDFRHSNNTQMGLMDNRDYNKRQGGSSSTYDKRVSAYYDNRERERESRYS